MKKVLLTLAVALTATLSYAAPRTIDWSVDQIISPTQMNSSSSTGTTFTFDIVLKNNGTDTVNTSDTVAYQLYAKNSGNQVIFAAPNGGVYIMKVKKIIAPGDTMHITGSITFNLYTDYSQTISFSAYSILLNRTSTGVANEGTGTTANNTKSASMTWLSTHGWGLNVNNTFVNNMSVYPNPAKDYMNITLQSITINSPIKVSVFDVNGREVYTETFSNPSNISINTSSFNKGLYTVKVVNGDLTSVNKVNIQ